MGKWALPGDRRGFLVGVGQGTILNLSKDFEVLDWVAREAVAAVTVICSHPCLRCGIFACVRPLDELWSAKMVPNIRLERMTYRLQGGCSTS